MCNINLDDITKVKKYFSSIEPYDGEGSGWVAVLYLRIFLDLQHQHEEPRGGKARDLPGIYLPGVLQVV